MAFVFEDDATPEEKERFKLEDEKIIARAQAPKASPSVGRRIAKAVVPYARPALEIGGALAGAALAAPANVLAPGVASLGGAGLGYAAGRRVARGLETFAGEKPPETAGQAFLGAARDVPLGAAMEAGGGLIGLPVQKGLQAAGRIAPRLYESALKGIPRTITPQKKTRAIQTALEEGIAPTQKGVVQLQDMIEEAGEKIGQRITDAQKAGDKIRTKEVLRPLSELKQETLKGETPSFGVLKLQRYAKDILKQKGKYLTPKEALNMKVAINKEISGVAYKVDPRLSAKVAMKKAVVEGVTDELVRKYPALRSENVTYANLKNLESVIEKTAEAKTKALMTLGDIGATGVGAVIGGGKGAALAALANKIINTPAITSRIAFILNKAAGKTGIPVAQRAIAYPAVGAGADQQDVETPQLPRPGLNIFEDMAGIGPTAVQAQEAPAMPQQLNPEQQATQAYLAGDYDTAIAGFQQAAATNPAKAGKYRQALQQIMVEKQRTQQIGGR